MTTASQWRNNMDNVIVTLGILDGPVILQIKLEVVHGIDHYLAN